MRSIAHEFSGLNRRRGMYVSFDCLTVGALGPEGLGRVCVVEAVII